MIDTQSSSVFISESVDDVTSGKLRQAVLDRSQQSAGFHESYELTPLCSSVSSVVNGFASLTQPVQSAKTDTPSPSQ
jgi:hypothetical protein